MNQRDSDYPVVQVVDEFMDRLFQRKENSMTKRVRIENADTADYKVIVQIWDKGQDSTPGQPGTPDTLAKEIRLDHPTAMTGDDVYLTSTRYIVVKEAS